MKVVAIIQARMGSTRFPGKVLEPLCDSTVLGYVIDRCKQCSALENVIVGTSNLPVDDKIEEYLEAMSVPVFRGNETDVLLRYVEAANKFSIQNIVRITADCPLIDPNVIHRVVNLYRIEPCDYAYIEGYPNGLGEAEVVSLGALEKALALTSPNETVYREHVTTYIYKHPKDFKLSIQQSPGVLNRPDLRFCLDEQNDLKVIRHVARHFYPCKDFDTSEIISYMENNPNIQEINKDVKQREIFN